MLRLILGAVALGTVGYGVKKYIEKDMVITDIKSYMQDIEKPKQKISKEELQKHFDNLFDRKIKLTHYIQETLLKDFAKDIKIKKDRVMQESITNEIVDNLNSYNNILFKITELIDIHIKTYELEPIYQAHQILKDILTTKIIKKGVLNTKSSELIEKANRLYKL